MKIPDQIRNGSGGFLVWWYVLPTCRAGIVKNPTIQFDLDALGHNSTLIFNQFAHFQILLFCICRRKIVTISRKMWPVACEQTNEINILSTWSLPAELVCLPSVTSVKLVGSALNGVTISQSRLIGGFTQTDVLKLLWRQISVLHPFSDSFCFLCKKQIIEEAEKSRARLQQPRFCVCWRSFFFFLKGRCGYFQGVALVAEVLGLLVNVGFYGRS